MYRRKLRAIGAPEYIVNLRDSEQFRELILWIEEEKLCHWKNDPDALIRFRETFGISWDALLDEYLGTLGCPFTSDDRHAVLEWLLRTCVANDYQRIDYTFRTSHDLNRVMILRGEASKGTVIERGQLPEESLSSVDENSESFREGVLTLAALLNVPVYSEHRVTLESIALVLHSATTVNGNRQARTELTEDTMVSLDSIPLGMAAPEPSLEPALRTIRLLHIANLRDLQTRFDEALVALQQITANPQTNSALGKIGRG